MVNQPSGSSSTVTGGVGREGGRGAGRGLCSQDCPNETCPTSTPRNVRNQGAGSPPAPPPAPPRRQLPVELDEVLLDPASVRSIRLEREILLECVLGLLVVFLLVVEKAQLAERFRGRR